jgi:hypothetical protein
MPLLSDWQIKEFEFKSIDRIADKLVILGLN